MSEPLLGGPCWVGVIADDVERQRAFYRDVLGMKELEAGDGYVSFDLDPHIVFEILQRSAEPDHAQRQFQVGFTVRDIHAARAALIARGVEAVNEVQGGLDVGAYWCGFRDAEGNLFEITQRFAPATPAEA